MKSVSRGDLYVVEWFPGFPRCSFTAQGARANTGKGHFSEQLRPGRRAYWGPPMNRRPSKGFRASPLIVAIAYAFVAVIWIVLSDRLLQHFVASADLMTRWSIVKGILFVSLSAALIYFLMARLSSVNRSLTGTMQSQTEALRKSEGKYRRVLETAQEGVWVVDRHDTTEFVNKRMADMLGFSMEEMIGKNPLEYVDPDRQPISARGLTGQQAFSSLELRLRRKDGSEMWASVSRGPLFDERGEYDGAILLVSDTSEHRKAEDDLRLQATALSAAANSIVITDPAGTILWVNPAFTATTGYEPEEVIGRNPRILKSGEHTRQFYQGLWNTIQTGRVWQGEMVNRHKDGHLFSEEMTIAPVRSREGAVTHFVAIKQDVTAHNEAREALRRNEQRFRRLVENIGDGILSVDAEGQIQYASESACKVSGYPQQQVVGRNIFQFVHEEDLAQVQNLFKRSVSEPDSTVQWGSRLRHRDGSWRYFEGTTSNRLADPDIAALVISFRDSTARQQTENALIRAEAKYRAIFENAALGIYLSAPRAQYLSMNPALASIYGFQTPEDAIQHSAEITSLYVDPETSEEFRRTLVKDGVVRNFEYEVCLRDGTRRWLLENARAVYGDQGDLLYYEGVVQDVTERKSLESQLRQAQKLDAVGRLAGGVAHDFNNMLGVILGYGDIMRTQLPSEHPALKSADEMQKAARRAANLTRQLLAFSRKQILQPQVLNLNSLIDELSKMLRRLIGEDIELVFRPGENIARVKADPGQLEQVIMNLAVNARDAMPRGGRLSIETINVAVDEKLARQRSPMRPGFYVLLSVTDTGSGMNAEVLSHIFEPFFTTKEQGKGTGLGLSIVYGIVKQSGGYVWVDSEPNRGSTFQIYLPPTTEAQAILTLPDARHAPTGGTETILLVEDDAALREMVRMVLTSAGYRILEACNGTEALSLLREIHEPVHLLMTDIIMPGMNGWELSQSASVGRPGIRTLFMTGFGVELNTFGIEIGPDVMLIAKPFSSESLFRKVRETLDSRAGAKSATSSP